MKFAERRSAKSDDAQTARALGRDGRRRPGSDARMLAIREALTATQGGTHRGRAILVGQVVEAGGPKAATATGCSAQCRPPKARTATWPARPRKSAPGNCA